MKLRRLLSFFWKRYSDSGTEDLTDTVFQAVEADDVSTLVMVLDVHGVRVLLQDSDPNQLTTLHLAAARGSREAVDYLLSDAVKADPRAARVNNFTPLHGAAMHGHTDICDVLLREGAQSNIQTDPQMYAPLHSAAFAGHVDTIQLLLANGGERAIDTARRQNQVDAIAVLEEANE